MTATTTDRDRLLADALKGGYWVVSDFGAAFTELTRGSDVVVIGWKTTDGETFWTLEGTQGEVLGVALHDIADAAEFLRGVRHRDAANARYFEVVEPSDGDLENADYRETDKNHAFVRSSFISHRERVVLAGPARDARSLARATGSRASTYTETVFGIELHVTWKRG